MVCHAGWLRQLLPLLRSNLQRLRRSHGAMPLRICKLCEGDDRTVSFLFDSCTTARRLLQGLCSQRGGPQHSHHSRLQGQTSSLFSIAGLPCLSSAAGLTLSARCVTLLLTSLFQIRAKNAGRLRVISARA